MAFSVIAVMIYLEPVLEALHMGEAVARSKRKTMRLSMTSKKNMLKFSVKKKRQREETKDDGNDEDGIEVKPEIEGHQLGTLASLLQRHRTDSTSVSAAHQSLKNKRMRLLTGSFLIVFSSTALLVNVVAFLVFPDKLGRTWWFNVYVVGFNLDSILFNLGVLVVCGGGTKRIEEAAVKKTPAPAAGSYAAVSFEANSQASSVYTVSEAGAALDQGEKKPGIPLAPVAEEKPEQC